MLVSLERRACEFGVCVVPRPITTRLMLGSSSTSSALETAYANPNLLPTSCAEIPVAVAIERNSTPSLLKCGNNIAGTYPPAPITPTTIAFSAFRTGAPPERNLSHDLGFRIVIEDNAEIRLVQISGNQLVSAIRFSNRKAVRRQSLDVDAPSPITRESSRCFVSRSNARMEADSRGLFLRTQDRNALGHTTSK